MTEPEYIVTDANMATGLSEAHQKAMIEKYGHIPELNQMVVVDEDGTEGGYTAYAEIPAEELEKQRKLRPYFFPPE